MKYIKYIALAGLVGLTSSCIAEPSCYNRSIFGPLLDKYR